MAYRVEEMNLLCLIDMLVQKIILKVNPHMKVALRSKERFLF